MIKAILILLLTALTGAIIYVAYVVTGRDLAAVFPKKGLITQVLIVFFTTVAGYAAYEQLMGSLQNTSTLTQQEIDEFRTITANRAAEEEYQRQEQMAADRAAEEEYQRQEQMAADRAAEEEYQRQEQMAADRAAEEEYQQQEQMAADRAAEEEYQRQEQMAADRAVEEERLRRERMAADRAAEENDQSILVGNWSGHSTSGLTRLQYSWRIEQDGENTTGTIALAMPGSSTWSTYRFVGRFVDGQLIFEGTHWIEKNLRSFCLASGELQYRMVENEHVLEGTWGPNSRLGGCPNNTGGNVRLRRI